jgi:hypothetical protein
MLALPLLFPFVKSLPPPHPIHDARVTSQPEIALGLFKLGVWLSPKARYIRLYAFRDIDIYIL